MHPGRGADTSHLGGEPGFVRVHRGALWWPDYPGNNMFNSLGNIVENPAAALLFFDFAVGEGLRHFTPERIAAMSGLPVDDARI